MDDANQRELWQQTVALEKAKERPTEPYTLWRYMNQKYVPDYWAHRKERDPGWEKKMARTMVKEFQIQSIVDFGCGCGWFIGEMYKKGVKIKGYEYNLDSVREHVDPDVLPFIEKADVSDPLDCVGFDCAMSIEVGEHLAPMQERNIQYVQNMTRACQRYIFFTAASPRQVNLRHINLHSKEYWIKLFEDNGTKYNENDTMRLLKACNKLPWYITRNLMVFIKNAN